MPQTSFQKYVRFGLFISYSRCVRKLQVPRISSFRKLQLRRTQNSFFQKTSAQVSPESVLLENYTTQARLNFVLLENQCSSEPRIRSFRKLHCSSELRIRSSIIENQRSSKPEIRSFRKLVLKRTRRPVSRQLEVNPCQVGSVLDH